MRIMQRPYVVVSVRGDDRPICALRRGWLHAEEHIVPLSLIDDFLEIMPAFADTVIGQPVLREVVGTDLV